MTSNGRGGRRYPPYVFTEQGVAMLSSVLGSALAIAINIDSMRTFVKVRGMAATHQDLAGRIGELNEKTERLVMQHETLMTPPEPPKRPIGFVPPRNARRRRVGGEGCDAGHRPASGHTVWRKRTDHASGEE